MRIALIIKDLRHCGAQRVMARLSFILRDAGHEVYMVLFTGQEIDYDYFGELIILNSSIKKGLLGKIKTTFQRTSDLRRIKKTYKIDAAISFLDTPNIANLLTKGKEKVFVSVRNFKSIEDKGIFGILNKVMIRILYPRADKVIVVSKAILVDMSTNYNVPMNKMTVVYNPYDVEQIFIQSNDEFPKKYQEFYNNHRVIVTVGRLFYQKGYWNLIKAFAHLKIECPDARLVIIGDGDQDNELKKLATDLSVEKDILFAGYQKNPFTFIKNADVYVMTSLFEGFPNALVEAMACGVPVVSVDCKSGPREILYSDADLSCNTSKIELADYGIICPSFTNVDDWDLNRISENQKTFANAIVMLLNNPELHSDYAKKAFERAKYFSLEECKKKYLEVIMGCQHD